MAVDLSNLTEVAQKQYSKLLKDIKHFKGVIEKAKIYTKESPSDALKRARAGYEHNKKQYDDHDSILEERIARTVAKLREEGRQDKENKRKYLLSSEEKLESLENEKSRTQVNAEIDLAKVQADLDKLLSSYKTSHSQPTEQPLTQASVEAVELPEASENDMLRAFMQPGYPEKPLTFITSSFSYCTVSEAKETNKGMQGIIPAGTSYDTNIYGPISTLERKKKGVKQVGVKA